MTPEGVRQVIDAIESRWPNLDWPEQVQLDFVSMIRGYRIDPAHAVRQIARLRMTHQYPGVQPADIRAALARCPMTDAPTPDRAKPDPGPQRRWREFAAERGYPQENYVRFWFQNPRVLDEYREWVTK